MDWLINFLKNAPNCNKLDLSSCGIEGKDMKRLSEGLGRNCIKTILLRYNPLFEDGPAPLVCLVQKCPKIKKLYLTSDQMNEEQYNILVAALSEFVEFLNLFIDDEHIFGGHSFRNTMGVAVYHATEPGKMIFENTKDSYNTIEKICLNQSLRGGPEPLVNLARQCVNVKELYITSDKADEMSQNLLMVELSERLDHPVTLFINNECIDIIESKENPHRNIGCQDGINTDMVDINIQKEKGLNNEQEESNIKIYQQRDVVKIQQGAGVTIQQVDGVNIQQQGDGVNIQQQRGGVNIQQQVDGVNIQQQGDGVNIQQQRGGVNIQQQVDGVNIQQQGDGVNIQQQRGVVNIQQQGAGVNIQQQGDGVNIQQQGDGVNIQQQEDGANIQQQEDGANSHSQIRKVSQEVKANPPIKIHQSAKQKRRSKKRCSLF